ncbi:uncharacterized protein LOC122298899 [Carya illinoinensis]|uniref:uncharacterized protein LOC122298899 n=1 Tax=Carya illinoinensis TaxID=32201 RepID=UPI001C7235F1|nr:uncharacterized protein LOC122298899 [Carya illinoinensis]
MEFRQTLEHCDLSDLGFEGDRYTWANNRKGRLFTKERLDRVLGNSPWIAKFEDHSIHHQAAYSSYHRPLLITIHNKLNRQRKERIFRFEAKWSKREGCEGLIRRTWENLKETFDPIHITLQGLRNCQLGLKQWNKELHKLDKELLQSKLIMLNHLKEQNEGQLHDEIRELQRDVNLLQDEENRKWQQRAKQTWLREGDRNTYFFHKCVN